jgi:hypothetical protein
MKRCCEDFFIVLGTCAGVCLYVLTAGALPFDEPNLGALFSKISRADYHTPAWFSEELAHLLHAILNPNPKERCAVLPFCALWAPQSWQLTKGSYI